MLIASTSQSNPSLYRQVKIPAAPRRLQTRHARFNRESEFHNIPSNPPPEEPNWAVQNDGSLRVKFRDAVVAGKVNDALKMFKSLEQRDKGYYALRLIAEHCPPNNDIIIAEKLLNAGHLSPGDPSKEAFRLGVLLEYACKSQHDSKSKFINLILDQKIYLHQTWFNSFRSQNNENNTFTVDKEFLTNLVKIHFLQRHEDKRIFDPELLKTLETHGCDFNNNSITISADFDVEGNWREHDFTASTPLMLAAFLGMEEATFMLIDKLDTNPKLLNADQLSAADMAIINGHIGLANKLMHKGVPADPIRAAAISGDDKTIAYYSKYGYKTRDQELSQTLIRTAKQEDWLAAAKLVEIGADPFAKEPGQESAFELAQKRTQYYYEKDKFFEAALSQNNSPFNRLRIFAQRQDPNTRGNRSLVNLEKEHLVDFAGIDFDTLLKDAQRYNFAITDLRTLQLALAGDKFYSAIIPSKNYLDELIEIATYEDKGKTRNAKLPEIAEGYGLSLEELKSFIT